MQDLILGLSPVLLTSHQNPHPEVPTPKGLVCLWKVVSVCI